MLYYEHSYRLTRIGVSCPPRSSTTASRRDTRGGRMQTESDATCLARVLPERPSPYPPSLFFTRSSFSSPYLLLSSRWLSARARPQAHFYWRRRCTNVQLERRGDGSLVKFQNLFVKRCFLLFLWIMGRRHNGRIFKWSTSVTKRLSFLFDFNL